MNREYIGYMDFLMVPGSMVPGFQPEFCPRGKITKSKSFTRFEYFQKKFQTSFLAAKSRDGDLRKIFVEKGKFV